MSLCAEHLADAELGSHICFMFKLLFVFVRSDAGGDEGELGSVLLSMRRGSLRECGDLKKRENNNK